MEVEKLNQIKMITPEHPIVCNWSLVGIRLGGIYMYGYVGILF